MSHSITQIIINLLDSNTVDSIILAKLLYGKIKKAEILHGRWYYHFSAQPIGTGSERIYLFNHNKYDEFGHVFCKSDPPDFILKAYPYYE